MFQKCSFHLDKLLYEGFEIIAFREIKILAGRNDMLVKELYAVVYLLVLYSV